MSVDVGSAVGYLDLDISGFLKGLRTAGDEANKSTKNMAQDIGNNFQTIGDSMSKVGSTMMTAITAPIAAMVGASVMEFAKLEQAAGGIETMFKKSASAVIENSETAYKRAGVSGVEYMEQVTSFSASLLQGLGGDTEEAARIADMAMVDMSDNANKFGTNIGMIQTAYQNFAKDNFMLLDNLKLGYGGNQAEMARLINDSGILEEKGYKVAKSAEEQQKAYQNLTDAQLKYSKTVIDVDKAQVEYNKTVKKYGENSKQAEEANLKLQIQQNNLAKAMNNVEKATADASDETSTFIATAENVKDIPYSYMIEALHIIQTEMGITGTTAKEATDTISGSFGAAKASVKDFLAGLGSKDSDMDQLTQNVIGAVTNLVSNVKEVLKTIWENIPLEPWQKHLIAAVAAVGPLLLVLGKVTSSVGGIIKTVSEVSGAFAKLGADFAKLGATATSSGSTVGAAFTAALGPIVAIIAIVAVLAAAFANLWKTNEEFRNKMTEIWEGIKAKVQEFCQGIVDRINELGFDFENITQVIKAIWDGFCNLLAPVFEAAWQQISDTIGFVLDAITAILDVFIGVFTGDWERAWQGIQDLFQGVVDFLINSWNNFWSIFDEAFNAAIEWIRTTWENFWQGVSDFFSNIWEGIKNFFVEMGENIAQAVVDFVAKVTEFFSDLPTNLGTLIGNIIGTVAAFVRDMILKAIELGTKFVQNVVEFFTTLPGKVKNFLDSAWDNTKKWASDMWDKAKEMGKNFINGVVEFFTDLPTKVKKFLDDAINKVKEWVTDMGKKGKEAIQELSTNIVNEAQSLPQKMWNIGVDIVNGVWKGIQSMWQTFTSNISNFFGSIVSSVKNKLGIESPSTVFAKEIGRWLPPGVANGFMSALPAAIKKIQSGLDDGVDSLDTNDIGLGINTSIDGFVGSLKDVYANVALWFESIEKRINTSISNMAENLSALMYQGHLVLDAGSGLGYVSSSGFGKAKTPSNMQMVNNGDNGDGDTFVFYSPRAISEVEAARLLKNTKRDMAEGF